MSFWNFGSRNLAKSPQSKSHLPDQYRISGLDFLKFAGAVAMCLIHSGLFLSRGAGIAQPNPVSYWGLNFYLLIGFFSLIIPSLAGSALRSSLDRFYIDGKLHNYSYQNIWGVSIFLMFLESTKNALLYEPLMFFSWDVLHFISISFLIIVYISKYSNKLALWIFCLASVLVGAFVPGWLGSAAGATSLNVLIYTSRIIFRICLLIGPALIILSLSQRIFSQEFSKYRRSMTVASALIGLFFTMIIWSSIGDKVFFGKVSELMPLGMLIKIPATFGHMWPLFPWFSLVGLGYLLNDAFINYKNSARVLWLSGATSFLLFLLFFQIFFDSYRTLMVKNSYFASNFFSANTFVIGGIACFFIFLLSFSTWFFDKISVKSKVISNISKGLLFYYLIHLLFASVLYRPFTLLLGPKYSLVLFPWLMMILSYAVLTVFIFLFGGPLQITIRKRK